MTNGVLALVGFVAALATALLVTPVARKIAVRLGVLDHPRDGKHHLTPTPYLGGLAILGGVAASILGTGAWRELGGVAIGAALLAAVGFLDDVRNLKLLPRLAVQGLAAGLAVAGGIRAAPTGIEALDIAISVLWLLGITNAFNLLDNMNGLSAGAAAVAASSFFFTAALGGQRLVGALAAAVAGGALGFFIHNFPRGRIFMGDGGSLPLGFLLGVVSLKVRFPVAQPWSFVAPVCVLGLACVDTAVVILGRLRGQRPVFEGGTDHLSHRLVARGLSSKAAVGLLLAAAAILGTVGVLGGEEVIPPLSLVVAGIVAAAGGLWLLRAPARKAVPERTTGRATRALIPGLLWRK